MAKAFTIELEGKTPKPFGVGPKLVMGVATFNHATEAIHASDINLKNIKALFFMEEFAGSHPIVTLDSPGSYQNYASVVCRDLVGTTAAGTVVAAGDLTSRFLAIGE